MDVTVREVTSGVGGYANVSLNMQLELHISAIVVHLQLLWLRRQQWYWCETVGCCVLRFCFRWKVLL